MPVARLADVIEPTVFADYTSVYSPENNVLVTSGVVVRSPDFDARVAGPGSVVDMPFWNDLSDEEADTMTDNPEDIAQPTGITADEQIARKQLLHKSWGEAALANELSGSDALEEIGNKSEKYWTLQFKRRVLASFAGVLADNVANDNGDMVHNIAIDGATAGIPATANYFSGDAFIDAGFTSGDRFQDTTTVAMHSDIYARVLKNNDVVKLADVNGMIIEYFKGKRVIVDDQLPVSLDAQGRKQYVTFLFGGGAIAYGSAAHDVPVEITREAAQGNGGGVNILHTRKRWILHPFGFKFNSASLSAPRVGSTSVPITAKEADLRKAVNWTRVVERKLVPIAFLISN